MYSHYLQFDSLIKFERKSFAFLGNRKKISSFGRFFSIKFSASVYVWWQNLFNWYSGGNCKKAEIQINFFFLFILNIFEHIFSGKIHFIRAYKLKKIGNKPEKKKTLALDGRFYADHFFVSILHLDKI